LKLHKNNQSKNKLLILFTSLLFCNLNAKSQDKVYMPYFQLEKIYWEYQISAAKTFKTFLDSNKRYTLVLPQLNGSTYPNETFTQTIANANSVGAIYFIKGKLTALNDVMQISMSMYNTSDSSNVWSDTLVVRTTYDLDSILLLFADNIGTDKKASEDGKIYSLANYSQQELVKYDPTMDLGFSISGGYTIADRGNHKVSPGIGFLISYDSKPLIFDFQVDYFPGNYHKGVFLLADMRVSGLYPLKTSKTTPFIGGSIAFSGVRLTYPNPIPGTFFTEQRADGMGLAIFVNGGYLINRNSNYNFRLVGSLFCPLFQTSTFHPLETRIPFGFMINAVILGHK
jgi:hypothetical protein